MSERTTLSAVTIGSRAEVRRSSGGGARLWFTVARQVFLALFSAFAVLPGIFTIFASFKSLYDFYNAPLGLPAKWLWENYVAVWNDAGIPQAALNSLIVVVLTVPICVLCSSCAAYGLAR
ncbi:MAG TPA: hypothetical protein VKT80_17670, partial [Chloroflexota bacterium]|nr:hypothetical protein [Chloroflexota bacterium]